MVLDYYPVGINKIDILFGNTKCLDKESKKEKILNIIDNRFCKYYIEKENKIYICGKKIKNKVVEDCCVQHLKYMYPDIHENIIQNRKKDRKKYYLKKEKKDIHYCISTSKRHDRCRTRVKNEGELCCKHKEKNNIYIGSEKICFGDKIELKNINNIQPDKRRRIILKKEGFLHEPLSFSTNIEFNYKNYKNIKFGNIWNKPFFNSMPKEKKEITNKKRNFLVYDKCRECGIELEPSLYSKNCDKCFNNKNDFTEYKEIKNMNSSIKETPKIDKSNINNDLQDLKKYYEKINNLALFIKSNKKFYMSEIYKNKVKYFYYHENYIRKLFENINEEYRKLLENLYNYGKNNCFEFLDEYKNNVDKLIIEFSEYEDKYNKLYL